MQFYPPQQQGLPLSNIGIPESLNMFRQNTLRPLMLTPCPPGYNLQVVGGELMCVLEGEEQSAIGGMAGGGGGPSGLGGMARSGGISGGGGPMGGHGGGFG